MEDRTIKTVTLIRHPFAFYVAVTLAPIFYIGIGIASSAFGYYLFTTNEMNGKGYLAPFFSIGCFYLAIYTIKKYVRSTPNITLTDNHIYINQNGFPISDIKHVVFSRKYPFRYIVSYSIEGMLIEFKDGTTKILYDEFYSNLWELKYELSKLMLPEIGQGYFEPSERIETHSQRDFENAIVINRLHVLSGTGVIF